MNRNIEEVEITIFDTETTGLEPQSGDRVVEIAAVKLKGNQRLAEFQSLVNPQRKISPAAFAVNQITPEMLKDAPDINMVMPKFLDFVGKSCLCSYNAAFDLEFVNHELEIMGAGKLENVVVIDILKMARRLLPGLERYALWFVAKNLGVKAQQKHRAFSDVELTLEVFNKFKTLLNEKGIIDFRNFTNLFSLSSHFLDSLNNQKLVQVQQALDLGMKLKIKYLASSNAQVSEREVIPKEIRKDRDHYYLIGHCCLKNEERSFRIDGILHIEIV